MPIMRCSETGVHTPKFNIDLCEGFDKHEPYLGFMLPDECWLDDDDSYDGAGVFVIDLKDILDDYLKNYWSHAHGEFTHKVINLLREYADKIESSLRLNK